MNITLVSLGTSTAPSWKHGKALAVPASARALSEMWGALQDDSEVDAVLFWDDTRGWLPSADLLQELLAQPVDIVHAGPHLGLGPLPRSLVLVQPVWLLGYNNANDGAFSSFRLSFQACLIRQEVISAFDGPLPSFSTLDGAGLEYGHRACVRGALMRCDNALIDSQSWTQNAKSLPIDDELRFCRHRFGAKWAAWAAVRLVLSGKATLTSTWNGWRASLQEVIKTDTGGIEREIPNKSKVSPDVRVSVLIPTVERPRYLRSTLAHLRCQTHPIHEVVIVDQTPQSERDLSYLDEFGDLPIISVVLDEAGQCASRNEGLARISGDWILLLDDDVDLPQDNIERHLAVCRTFEADASSGVSEEEGVPTLPAAAKFVQMSAVFPGGNTLVSRAAVLRVGGFDLAYDKGIRADGDLGQRLHAAGCLLILDPSNSVFHHHAPRGGLRRHKARVVTRAKARMSLLRRNLLTPHEVYLAFRHFGEEAAIEVFWQRALSSLSMDGTVVRRVLRLGISVLRLPETLWRQRCAFVAGRAMLNNFPQIPSFPTTDVHGQDGSRLLHVQQERIASTKSPCHSFHPAENA